MAQLSLKRIYRWIIVLLFFLILSTALFIILFPREQKERMFDGLNEKVSCFQDMHNETLPDITDYQIVKGKSIFFHDTTCKSSISGNITIHLQQACAVESAALMNPNYDIYLTYSSPGTIKNESNANDKMLQSLQQYPNLKIVYLNFKKYLKGSYLDGLYKSGKIIKGPYAVLHSRDVLRYLTLYKFGGIYLDADVIVMKTLEGLQLNFAAAPVYNEVGAAVLGLDHEGYGHDFAKSCLLDLKHNFKHHLWSDSSLGVVNRLTEKVCGRISDQDYNQGKFCTNFRLYPKNMFYPIYYMAWDTQSYTARRQIRKILDAVKTSYTCHFFENPYEPLHVPTDQESVYSVLAKKYCPLVFKEWIKYS